MQHHPSHNPQYKPQFVARLAKTDADVVAAQRLRYDVFIKELGSDGPMVDHQLRLERDQFDAVAGHFLLFDEALQGPSQLIGTYRFLTAAMASQAGRFYCAHEYDLQPLRENGGQLMELGRSCLHPAYRGGAAMLHLWAALADYVTAHRIETLFGVASFHGTNLADFAQPLSLLHHHHLAPAPVRVRAIGKTAMALDAVPVAQLDRLAAVRAMPALIKAYLRLGATVGEGAFVDHAFQTTDVCIILQSGAVSAMQKAILAKGRIDG